MNPARDRVSARGENVTQGEHEGSASGGTAAHYERLAGGYDRNWNYGGGFVDWMAREVVDTLALTAADRIADIGCGTGLYTRRVREIVRPSAPILCVDPSAAMLAQLPADPGLRPVRASAEELAGIEISENTT
ncbi:class I SAM-dependent methyltransferase, partial [Candidatus Frankia nodulisporulans]